MSRMLHHHGRARTSNRVASTLGRVIAYLLLALMVVGSIFPLVVLFLTSLKARIDVLAYPPVWIFKPTLDNYRNILGTGGATGGEIIAQAGGTSFQTFFTNSVIVGTVTTIFSLLIGSIAAYSLARYNFKGKKGLAFALIALRMVPPIAIVIPLYIMAARVNLLDSKLLLILVYTSLNLSFVVWMLRGFFIEIPREVEEAAIVDGATRIQAFFSVLLPLVAPGLAATAVFTLIQSWNEFTVAYILTQRASRTLPVFLASFAQTEEGTYWGEIGAIVSLVLLPIVVFTLMAQRHLVKGMTMGAVKG
ncbi:MAG TPA: carbohydrate ABC transporter permease [Firmicutes bacterium]|nr:carbohydrate ABC transporter permease [Bacillota bacterium]